MRQLVEEDARGAEQHRLGGLIFEDIGEPPCRCCVELDPGLAAEIRAGLEHDLAEPPHGLVSTLRIRPRQRLAEQPGELIGRAQRHQSPSVAEQLFEPRLGIDRELRLRNRERSGTHLSPSSAAAGSS